ncbi:MAG: undecaprenyl/decaprenyl-phosphate alpha-N-acetylglucosaminyl 1-phosphate transferase [Syntrophobacterales bacterium]|nr:undecaprenyl/decaprenyl-phosphate alpha-N-acetylglucosaminyl 1-phosphate transferase [Syntrophobacterales bacterium]
MMIALLLIAFFTSWGLVFITTPLLVKIATKIKLLDIPSDRKVHEIPTPRIGGLALFLAFFIPFVIFYFSMMLSLRLPFTYLFYRPDWLGVFVGAILIFLTGFLDDLSGVPPRLKLVSQFISALAVVLGGLGIEKVLIPPWGVISFHPLVSALVTVIWCLLIINGFNFIDGLDGLAAGIAFICGLFLLIIAFITNHYYMTLPVVMLAGATIGFLHYNFNPAKIFMGDSGSYFLGYALATSALRISRDDSQGINLIIPALLILALPMIDVIVATLRRILRREHIFKPDCYHIHHCILNRGFSHRQSVLILYGVNCSMGLLAVSYFHLSPSTFWLLFSALIALLTALASSLGYFDWLFDSSLILSIKEKLKFIRFRTAFSKDLWMLEKASTIEDMRKRLVSALAHLNLDYAKLTIFYPPLNDKASEEFAISKPLPSSPFQLNIPITEGKKVLGYLFVEKNIPETSLSHKLLFTLLNRTTKSLLTYILRNPIDGNRYSKTGENTWTSNIPKRQTYILIAKGPYSERLH